MVILIRWIFLCLTAMIVASGCSKKTKDGDSVSVTNVTENEVIAPGEYDKEVFVSVRNRADAVEDNYLDATYSFFYLTKYDVELTHNEWDLILHLYGDQPRFDVYLSGKSFGRIADLGRKSCKDIKLYDEADGEYPGYRGSRYPHKSDRKLDSGYWFRGTEAYSQLLDARSSSIEAKEGHCYVLFKKTNEYKILTVFHVKMEVPQRGVLLDEIEVITRVRDAKDLFTE